MLQAISSVETFYAKIIKQLFPQDKTYSKKTHQEPVKDVVKVSFLYTLCKICVKGIKLINVKISNHGKTIK